MDFSDYDIGFRHGVFDKCNGRPCLVAGNGDNSLWDGGYLDGWKGNDVILQPKTSEELDLEALHAGRKLGTQFRLEAAEKASAFEGYEESFHDGVFDEM